MKGGGDLQKFSNQFALGSWMFLLLAKGLHFCISDHAETLIWFQQAADAEDLRDQGCFGFIPLCACCYKKWMFAFFNPGDKKVCAELLWELGGREFDVGSNQNGAIRFTWDESHAGFHSWIEAFYLNIEPVSIVFSACEHHFNHWGMCCIYNLIWAELCLHATHIYLFIYV